MQLDHVRAVGLIHHCSRPDKLIYNSRAMHTARQESRPFGKLLRQERQRLGLTQTQLAAVGGVSKATQVAYEADSTKPHAEYLSRVAGAGVDVTWLLTGHRVRQGVQWDLLFEIRDLIDEWAAERGKPTTAAEKDGLLRNLYAQFCSDRYIDEEQLAATFRLVG